MKLSQPMFTVPWLLFIGGFYSTYAAKILGIFLPEAKSHFFFHKGIMNSLVDAGHEVTFLSPFPDPNSRINFTFINSKISTTKSQDGESPDFRNMLLLEFILFLDLIYMQYCYDFMQITEIQNLLNSDTKIFDVIFVEMLPLYECYLPVAKKFGIPVIGTFSMRPWSTIDGVFGNPHPLVIPSPMSPFPQKMTFFGRLQNALITVITSVLMTYIWSPEKFYLEYFPEYNLQPDRELSLLFTNNHASIFSTPLVPNMIEIAGIHLTPVKSLPKDIEKFIEEAEYGVILFTFGSVTKSNVIGTKLRTIFRETFADLPQRVIWKFEEHVENVSKNVLISEWIPQRDILAHKNVKAFITHCGISGTYEAIDAGVPLVLIPVFGDQLSNAAFLQELGVGVQLDINYLTKEILLKAINAVLHNEKYVKRMRKLSKEFWDRPMSPQKSVVYWTEYVLRYNGTKHIRSATADVPFHQYLFLDFIFLAVVALFVIIYSMWSVSKFVCKVRKMNFSMKNKKEL